MLAVTYSGAGLGVLYFYVLYYYFKKNWDTVFGSTLRIIFGEIFD